MKMSRLTIVQPEPVSPCIAMAESGLATAQIAKKGYQYWDLTPDLKTPNNLW